MPSTLQDFVKSEEGPYIPGSSIKGFLKRALCHTKPEYIEKWSNNSNPNESLGKAIQVIDSMPLKDSDLIIDEIRWYHSNGNSGKHSAYAEFLKPETKIECLIRIDESKIIKKDIEEAIRKYNQWWNQKLRDGHFDRFVEDENVFRLGKYTNAKLKSKSPDKNGYCIKISSDVKENGICKYALTKI